MIYSKVNFHAHTKHSDGQLSIFDQAKFMKALGFQCCIITDHFYQHTQHSQYSIDLEEFGQMLGEATAASKQLSYPIIVGCEMSAADIGSEEFNVFGHEAIRYLMKEGVSYESLAYVKDNFNCAIQLNHPRLTDVDLAKTAKFIDCFERFNSGSDYFPHEHDSHSRKSSKRRIPDEFRNITQLSNSDAHSDTCFEEGYNYIDTKIESEADIINFLKYSKPKILVAQGCMYGQVPHEFKEPDNRL